MNTERFEPDRKTVTGRRRRGFRLLAAALALTGVSGAAVAMEAPEPPVESQAAQRIGESERLVDRLLGERQSPVRSLDPAIFIELSPVTASEPAVRLPKDQQDED